MEELFCLGDDDYKSNVCYVIGFSKSKLFYHAEMLEKYGVIYTDELHQVMNFSTFTDAQIHIHGLVKQGIEEAKKYKVFKITSEIRECENYVNDER